MQTRRILSIILCLGFLVFSHQLWSQSGMDASELQSKLAAWQTEMDNALERLKEVEAISASAQYETALPKLEALLESAKETVDLLSEEKQLIEEGEHLARDIERSQEEVSRFALLKKKVREDILSSKQVVTEKSIDPAKIEADIASANTKLWQQQRLELDAQIQLNQHKQKALSEEKERLDSRQGKWDEGKKEGLEPELRKLKEAFFANEEDVLEVKERLLDLQVNITSLKSDLLEYREAANQLDAEIKMITWQSLKEKLARDEQEAARNQFAVLKVQIEQDKLNLKNAIGTLEEKKTQWDQKIKNLEANPPEDQALFIEQLALYKAHQDFADNEIRLSREKLSRLKLDLSLEFLYADGARIRSEIIRADQTLDGLQKLSAYVAELWQTVWSEETVIRSRQDLVEVGRDQTEQRMETYRAKREAAEDEIIRRTLGEITALLQAQMEGLDEILSLQKIELATVASKKDSLRPLRTELTEAIAKRPDSKLGYRRPFLDNVKQVKFWAFIGLLLIAVFVMIQARKRKATGTDDASFLLAAHRFLRRAFLWASTLAIINALIFLFGWINVSQSLQGPMLVIGSLILAALLIRSFVFVGISRLDRRKKKMEAFGSGQSMLFVQSFIDILLAGGLFWAIVAIYNLSLESPVIEKAKPFLTYPLISSKTGQISPLSVIKGVIVFLLFLYVSRLFKLFLSDYLFPNTKFDPGVRNAVRTITHYLLIVVGALVALSVMGLNLTTLTVFAGALGVGIGFGLQNIANNFLSGLILLFERPVKTGDYIKVGNDFGQVRRIGARATLLRTRDNTFIVVPNANLISQDVVNWTHDDSKTRIRIPVSVAYGTDVDKVDEICLGIAKESPKILDFPAPELCFKEFGESSLDFELLVWISSPMVLINNDVNRAIFKAFAQANIEIPFPQRDLHIRSTVNGSSDLPTS